jgi:uncharacterized membrane protein
MANTSWTFAVIFMSISVVLLVFAVMWLMSLRPGSNGEHLQSNPSAQEILDRRLLRSEVSPDEYDEMPYELEGGSASGRGGRPAEPVHV